MKPLFVFLFVLLYNISLSQNTFELIYNRDYAQKPVSLINVNECFIASFNEYSTYQTTSKLLKISSIGNIIDSLILIPNNNSLISDIVKINNDEIIVIGSTLAQNISDTEIWVIRMNNNFEITWKKKLLVGYKLQRVNTKQNSREKLVIYGGVSDTNGYNSSVLFEISTDGELLKTFFYGKYQSPCMIFDILEKKNNQGYFVYQFNDSSILNIDTNFNIINKRLYFPQFNDGYHLLPNSNNTFWLTDSTYLISGKKIGSEFDLALIIADTNHNTLKSFVNITTTRDMVAFWNNISFIEKDNIYFLGTLNSSFNPYETYPNQMILFNFNDTLGLNWQKTFGGDAYYNATNLIATQDGGCLIAATRSDASNYQDYDMCFLKLDSLGNLTHINGKPVDVVSDFAVYPTPASDFINIKKGVQIGQADFVLYNSIGQTVLQKTLTDDLTSLDISGLTNGVYIYNITQNGKIIDNGKVIKE